MEFFDFSSRSDGSVVASQRREFAHDLAMRGDINAAVACARDIGHPWFKCQALAWVAWFTRDVERFDDLIDESVRTAEGATDSYQTVGGLAWPINASILRGRMGKVMRIVERNLGRTAQIEPPSSIAEALSLQWQGAYELQPASDKIFLTILRWCPAINHWRAWRAMRDVALMIAARNRDQAQVLMAAMPDNRFRRQAMRDVAAGRTCSPRQFFW